jgi:pimeloyl-ACP methyl ester carboxylesterase
VTTKPHLLFFALAALLLQPSLPGFAQDQHIESSGVPIRFVDSGEGSPVVLLHGYMLSVEMWSSTGVVQNLSEQFRVIAMDSRGHGRSGKPHGRDAYGMEMVSDVVRLLDALDIEEAHIVGFSMGAEIALKLATRYPERVRSLIMVGSGWSGTEEFALYRRVADSLEKSASFGPILRAMTPTGAPDPTDEEIAAADAMLVGQDMEALIAAARAMDAIVDVSREELTAFRVPVLGIAGEHDPERGNLEKMIGVIPDFTMELLEDRGHMDVVFDSQFNSIIMSFLSGEQ